LNSILKDREVYKNDLVATLPLQLQSALKSGKLERIDKSTEFMKPVKPTSDLDPAMWLQIQSSLDFLKIPSTEKLVDTLETVVDSKSFSISMLILILK
jgi:hypothetical protein